MSSRQPAVLVVLDGYGDNPSAYGNAIAAASTPVMDGLAARWPHTLVAASGEAVGLPPRQQGNSEVGHLTIGSGRVLFQPLSRISRSIADGSFYENPVLLGAVRAARQRGAALHLIGLISPGGVHSHQEHALALCELARREGLADVQVHVVTDGRDEPPSSAAGFVRGYAASMAKVGAGRIASVSGRYYAMDRDHRWERTALAYSVIVEGFPRVALDPVAYIEAEYAAGRTDEFILPAAIADGDGRSHAVADGDSVIVFNFRPDRARQITHALCDATFDGFVRGSVRHNLDVVTFTEYERSLTAAVAFPRQEVDATLAEVVSRAGLRQFHTAETEKYAHVTYFINGGREEPFPGEERRLVPSQKVATYDLAPEMSAAPVTDEVVGCIGRGDAELVIVNYANPDMVGHTGDLTATVRGIEVVDACLGRLVDATLAKGGAVLITADHGNAEMKLDAEGSALTAHTTSPVPVILCGTDATSLAAGGGLEDVAPTLLEVMGLERPEAMTGRSLIRRG
jgi:2,3-bisphosphoglycerate-independent phosphoglycerate mutase